MVMCLSEDRPTKGEAAQTHGGTVTSSSSLLLPTDLCIAILRSIDLQLLMYIRTNWGTFFTSSTDILTCQEQSQAISIFNKHPR